MTEHDTQQASELASKFKGRGYDKYYAWDMFIVARGLKPELDAKDFYKIFDTVTASYEIQKVPDNFKPTHFDNYLKKSCQITNKDGYKDIIWADGYTGSEPDSIFLPERYIEVSE